MAVLDLFKGRINKSSCHNFYEKIKMKTSDLKLFAVYNVNERVKKSTGAEKNCRRVKLQLKNSAKFFSGNKIH
jgi:hypothetical protein